MPSAGDTMVMESYSASQIEDALNECAAEGFEAGEVIILPGTDFQVHALSTYVYPADPVPLYDYHVVECFSVPQISTEATSQALTGYSLWKVQSVPNPAYTFYAIAVFRKDVTP